MNGIRPPFGLYFRKEGRQRFHHFVSRSHSRRSFVGASRSGPVAPSAAAQRKPPSVAGQRALVHARASAPHMLGKRWRAESKTTCLPAAYASAPTARTERAATASSWILTCEKSHLKRGSKNARVAASSGWPGEPSTLCKIANLASPAPSRGSAVSILRFASFPPVYHRCR